MKNVALAALVAATAALCALPLLAGAETTWTAVNSTTTKAVCTTGTESAPTQSTEGFSLSGVSAYRITATGGRSTPFIWQWRGVWDQDGGMVPVELSDAGVWMVPGNEDAGQIDVPEGEVVLDASFRTLPDGGAAPSGAVFGDGGILDIDGGALRAYVWDQSNQMWFRAPADDVSLQVNVPGVTLADKEVFYRSGREAFVPEGVGSPVEITVKVSK